MIASYSAFELSSRQQEMLERLEIQGRVSVAELAKALKVSEVTVRKDLQELESFSLLKRVHGGAALAHRSKYNLSIGDKIGKESASKLAIAKRALECIHDGDTLILDAGSTTLALARLLPGRFQGLTIITNSLPIIAELSRFNSFELISLGGMVRLHSLAMIGPLTVTSLKRLHADRTFLGATGVTLERGLCTPNIIEAETKAAMIAAATERIALVDHTKIGQASLAPFVGWDQLNRFITDLPLPIELAEELKALGVTVQIASEEQG